MRKWEAMGREEQGKGDISMKTRTLKTLVLVSVFLMAAGTMSASQKGLVAYYPFNEGQGDIAHDQSGKGNDGKIIGGTEWAKGAFGTALKLDGKDGYVDCGVGESLVLSKTGTISFWFKAKDVPQGGLVGWSAGEGNPNQRLVVSLNTYERNKGQGVRKWEELGVYMSDGKKFYKAHGAYHKIYFPPADQWIHFTVTFNGRSVDLYKDGVIYFTKPQSLRANTKDVAMWIGRCIGMGGAGDYFKGLLDEVRIYNRALSEQEVYAIYMKDAAGRDKDTDAFGSIAIKPVVNPKAGTIFADLDYHGLAPAPKKVSISAKLLDAKRKVVAKSKVRMIPAWGRAEVTFDVHDLPAGDYIITAAAGNKGAAIGVNWPGRAKGWGNVKVLNNLCWELLNESPGGKHESSYTFTNPRRGWIYFITDADEDITLSVKGAKPDVIRKPKNGAGRQEAMRWVPKGEYAITVTGDGKLKSLVVRSVATLTFGHYPHVQGTGNDHEFLAEHVLDQANRLITGNYNQDYNTDNFRTKWADEMGRQSIEILYTRPVLHMKELKGVTDKQKIHDTIKDWVTRSPGMNNPEFHGILLDEFDPGNEMMAWYPTFYDEWIKVSREVLTDPKYAGRMIIPYICYNMYDYEKSAAFVKNFVDLGSHVAWEVYLFDRETEGRAWVTINDRLADQMDDWARVCGPKTVENMIVVLSYLTREDRVKDVNYNVFMDMQIQHLATRPEFFGLAGVEEYVSHHSRKPMVIQAAKLYRHYGLEGNTERLCKEPYKK
ncbi:MAG TPA: LamG domain-containing protein [Phycisphaerae bacterium]|nr:LamG domain-containing protein [Phycisphaerae bacterium]